MENLLISALILASTSAVHDASPASATASRIIVAPFCGLSSKNPIQSRQYVGEIRNYCNAIYYAPWLFLERRPSHLVNPNEYDPTELNFQLSLSEEFSLPCILTLHWGPTGQPDMMEWIAEKYAPSVLWQVNLDGSLARHPTDPFGNLPCLQHPGLRTEIESTYQQAVTAAKQHPGYRHVLSLGGTTEPMIARGDLTQANDCRPSGFCFNPAHISWWRDYLSQRWKSISDFNNAFGTHYAAFGEIQASTSSVTSPLFAEYERGLRESLLGYETWQMELMRRLEPDLPLLNHIASVLSIVGGGVRGSYTTYDAGSAIPGVPGGSVYTVPGHIADYAAIQMDGHRSFNQESFAAIELGILGTWDGRGEEYKVWYSQMAARFKKIWSAPYSWAGGGSNLRGTDAKDGLKWGTYLGTLDVGQPYLPAIAILTNHDAWSWSCDRARNAEMDRYRQLFKEGIDRVIVSERQIEKGWLETNSIRALVLADPFVLSKVVMDKIKSAESRGLIVAITGVLPELDELGKPLPADQVAALANHPNTMRVSNPADLSKSLISRLELPNCMEGFEIIPTDRGWCLVNVSHCQGAQRVTEPPERQVIPVNIGDRSVAVPVQYFTFLNLSGEEAHWIDAQGVWHVEKPEALPAPPAMSVH